MVGQARRRSGAEVHEASVEHLPAFSIPFDKVLAVDTVGHWTDQRAGIEQLKAVMRSGATIALSRNPVHPGRLQQTARKLPN